MVENDPPVMAERGNINDVSSIVEYDADHAFAIAIALVLTSECNRLLSKRNPPLDPRVADIVQSDELRLGVSPSFQYSRMMQR